MVDFILSPIIEQIIPPVFYLTGVIMGAVLGAYLADTRDKTP